MENKRKSISLLGWIIGALLLIYLGVFCYLNLCRYTQHVDSDIAAEALLAREIWVEKDITPNDWISSTERRIIGMPTVAAAFYGITGSMKAAVGIACVLLCAILLGTFYFFLRKLSLSRQASVTALLVLCALPANGFRNEGQMVPFVTLLLFLFAEYYVFHGIFLFLNILFYIKLREKQRITRKIFLEWLVLFVAAVLLNCGGQRCLQVIILPLLVVEVIALFTESGHFKQKLPGGRYLPTAYVGSLVLAFLVSCLYGGRGDYAVYLLQPREMAEKLLLTVPAAIQENFGLAGNAKVGSFASLIQLLLWDPAGIWTLVCVPGKSREHRQTEKCADDPACFGGSDRIYYRDHQCRGGPLLLFHGMVRGCCSGSGDGGSYAGETAGIRGIDLNGGSIVCHTESEIHLL